MQLRVVGGSDDKDGDGGDSEKRGPGRPAAVEFDPWDTDKGHSYSINEFYTRSTNKFDHSKEARAAMPTNIHAQIQSLVDSKKFGAYRSIGDFIRDATVHRLRTIAEWLKDEELLSVLTIEERICKADRDESELEVKDGLLIRYANAMERHVKDNDAVRLASKINEVEDWAFYLTPPHLERANELADKYRKQLKLMQDALDKR